MVWAETDDILCIVMSNQIDKTIRVTTTPVGGNLSVGILPEGDVAIHIPPNTNGLLVFSPRQARAMAKLLESKATEAENYSGEGHAIPAAVKGMIPFGNDRTLQ